MKFRKIKRPKLAASPREKARVIRRVADVCPWCGAIESLRAYRTKRQGAKIVRYSRCTICGRPVTRVVSIQKDAI